MSRSDLTINWIDLASVDTPIAGEFTISAGSITVAEAVFVRVRLSGGAEGYGEIAPFTAVTGETRIESLAAARCLVGLIQGQPASSFRRLSRLMCEAEPGQPAARCGLETAIIDAYCRALGVPMWQLWGGAAPDPVVTDITLPILSLERTLTLAMQWHSRGFRRFKMKVGTDVNKDIERVRKLAGYFSSASFLLDANQGFDEGSARAFIRELKSANVSIVLFEQPVNKDDLNAMAALRKDTGVAIAADESVASAADALRVIRADAADVINLKIMKSGVMEVMDIAAIARAAGKQLMIGGMMETRLAMGCSLSLVFGLGGIEHIDLDTPLLLAADPLEGGYRYGGPKMAPWHEAGLGCSPRDVKW
jgi:L-alanine-DL-glutamate epimerase-like enolase superfamily enzyme